ncbi:MAG: 4-hydroxy-tetrahydrodipicolinate reductase [Oscillospiraceae bacterium]
MTRIILNGANGKMCRVIDNCVNERNDCKIVAGFDIITSPYSDFPIFAKQDDFEGDADVIIDFSTPAVLDNLLSYALKRNIPLVIATTGYTAAQIEKINLAATKIPVFFTFNMSLGINLLVDLAKKAAKVLGTQFDIEIIEKHHNQKVDAPSGTAIMLADAINQTMDNELKYMYDRHSVRKKRDKNEIGIHSVRGGTIVGEHEVIFAGRDETITLSHTAMSKDVFAVGALGAAIFLASQAPGMYDMSNII